MIVSSTEYEGAVATIRLLVDGHYAWFMEREGDGQLFVITKPGQRLGLEVHNYKDYPFMFGVGVDGVDLFDENSHASVRHGPVALNPGQSKLLNNYVLLLRMMGQTERPIFTGHTGILGVTVGLPQADGSNFWAEVITVQYGSYEWVNRKLVPPTFRRRYSWKWPFVTRYIPDGHTMDDPDPWPGGGIRCYRYVGIQVG